MKVTVVGAGNVGATCADVIAHKDIVQEVVLLDIKEGIAEGKSLDIWQTAPINLYDTRTVGSTNDYTRTANSDVVVITSGLQKIGDGAPVQPKDAAPAAPAASKPGAAKPARDVKPTPAPAAG